MALRCPECGRSLPSELVHGLSRAPAPCPGCEAPLRADLVVGDDAPSVRPPDLEPDTVRTTDVLAGWDVGASAAEVAGWRVDERPFPTDTVVVTGAVLFGSGLGLLLAGRHRVRGGVAGALTGGLVAAVARRIWRLDGPEPAAHLFPVLRLLSMSTALP